MNKLILLLIIIIFLHVNYIICSSYYFKKINGNLVNALDNVKKNDILHDYENSIYNYDNYNYNIIKHDQESITVSHIVNNVEFLIKITEGNENTMYITRDNRCECKRRNKPRKYMSLTRYCELNYCDYRLLENINKIEIRE